MENIRSVQIALLQMNTKMSEIKNTLNGINIELDTVEEENSELEDSKCPKINTGSIRYTNK